MATATEAALVTGLGHGGRAARAQATDAGGAGSLDEGSPDGGAVVAADALAPPPSPPPPPPVPVPASPDGGVVSVVSVPRIPASAPREDVTAAASVVLPAASPRAVDDLGTLLLDVPGVSITRRGGFGSTMTLSLRGSNPDEVRVFLDGVPLNQAAGGGVDLTILPFGDVERIEVYRGSSPLAFGESALGGVVAIATRTPGTTGVAASAGGGSFRTTFARVTGGGAVGPLKLYAGLHAVRAVGDFPTATPAVAGGYQTATRENNDLAQLGGVFRAAVALPGRRELRLGFVGVWRDQGLPAEEIYRAVAARAESTRLLAHAGYDSRDDLGDSSRLRLALYASGLWDAFSDPLYEIVGVPTATHDRMQALGTISTAEKALGNWGRLTGLVEGRLERYLPHNDADPNAPAGYPADRETGVVGFELDAWVAPLDLHVVPSARLEVSRDVRTGRDKLLGTQLPPAAPITRALPVVRLGLRRALGPWATLRANVGRYARTPTFLELYGYNRGVIGNPTLAPERGTNADLGVTAEGQAGAAQLTTSVTAFGALVSDVIAWETFTYQTRAENVSRARVLGAEAEARLRHRRLTVVGQGTFTDARDQGSVATSAGWQLAHHPRYRGYVRAEWRQPLGSSRVTLSAYADLEGSAQNYWTTGPYGAIPPRVLAGAGLALSTAHLRLSASAFNLGDSRIHDFPQYPQPGRAVFVALGWSSASGNTVGD